MKIVRPYAKILPMPVDSDHANFSKSDGHDLLRRIEWSGRISHRSEESQGDFETTKRFIQAVVLGHGDWSIVEHATVSVDMLVDRGITHELVRHRLASYTQESTRFVNYEKKMPPSFIYPNPEVECKWCLSEDENDEVDHDPYANSGIEWSHFNEEGAEVACVYDEQWLDTIESTEIAYRVLIQKGWRPQEARSVFP